MAMRIVQLNPFYFPYAGGIERRMRATADALAARGHDVHVVTAALNGSAPGTTDEGDVHVHRLPSKFRLAAFYNPPLVATRGLDAELTAIVPDVVDYHSRWAPSYHRAFARVGGGRIAGGRDDAARSGAARVITYHNTFGEGRGLVGLASRMNDHAFMKHVRAAHRVVCVSRFLADELQHHAPAASMRVIPNGIHLRDIDAVSPAHAACVPRAPDGTPVPYVVATGRLVAVKGLDTVVRALPHAAGIHAVFVGEGPAAPGLRRLARRLGVADRVHLPGWVEEDEKIRLLRGAVAYTHPARFEAFGISVLEALAAGAPVVAARTGGVPELVGDAGLLLDHGPAHWAAAMTTLRDDEAARADLGRRGRAQAARFGWERVAQDLETVYEEAVRAA